jgi:hypothetical protein
MTNHSRIKTQEIDSEVRVGPRSDIVADTALFTSSLLEDIKNYFRLMISRRETTIASQLGCD